MWLPKNCIFLLLAAASVSSLWAQSAPAKDKDDVEFPVPVGMPVNGIKIPHYDSTGKLLMVFEAETAQKTDERRITMKNLKLESLDDEGKKLFINMPESFFDLDSRLLTGNKTASIRREDFTITGDAIEFNTSTRFGTMRGNILMTIQLDNNPQ